MEIYGKPWPNHLRLRRNSSRRGPEAPHAVTALHVGRRCDGRDRNGTSEASHTTACWDHVQCYPTLRGHSSERSGLKARSLRHVNCACGCGKALATGSLEMLNMPRLAKQRGGIVWYRHWHPGRLRRLPRLLDSTPPQPSNYESRAPEHTLWR